MKDLRQRVCLKCGKKFPSRGPGNRICKGCKSKNRNAYVPVKASGVMRAIEKRT